MIAPSPNEKRSDRSITARIIYFIIGAIGGGYLATRYSPMAPAHLMLGFSVLGGGLIGLIAGSAVFSLFK